MANSENDFCIYIYLCANDDTILEQDLCEFADFAMRWVVGEACMTTKSAQRLFLLYFWASGH